MDKDKKEASTGLAENLRDALVLRPEWEIKQKKGEAQNSFTVSFSESKKVLELTVDGQPLEYSDDEFQNTMRKLQQCSLKFEDMPIYIINEKVASELCYDQLRGYEENERSDI